MPGIWRRRSMVLIVAWLLHGNSLFAADSGSVFTDYSMERWGVNEGAPAGAIYALAQDQAGYLWLGTETGLYRFNGARFVFWTGLGSVAAGPVQALHVSGD